MPKKLTHEMFIESVKKNNANISIIGQYVNDNTKILVRCNLCEHQWETWPHTLKTGHGCPKCATKRNAEKIRYSNQEFNDWVKANQPDIILLTQYNGIKKDITCQCKKCSNIWTTKADNIKSYKGCPKCSRIKINNSKVKTNEYFIQKIVEKELQVTPQEEYQGSHVKIKVKCNKCNNIWEICPDNLFSGFGCPKCKASKGEKAIQNFLDNNNIEYEPQYRFKDCKDKKELPFDFYLPLKNICIEYDGEQHYKPITFGGIEILEAQKNFEEVRRRDSIKTNYCLNNNIKLIRIPYTKLNDIENILQQLL